MKKFFLFIFFTLSFIPIAHSQEYTRIISLCPSVTKTIESLGCANQLIGITSFCKLKNNQPITKVGTLIHPHIEIILSLKPDLILTEQGINQPHILEQLKNLGIQVIALKQSQSYDDIVDNFFNVAKLLNKEKLGEKIIKTTNHKINFLQKKSLFSSHKIFIELWEKPLITSGKNSYINDIILFSQGQNIFDDISQPYFKVSPEKIILKNPDFILLILEKNKINKAKKYWQTTAPHINAVINNHVIWLSQDHINYPCLIDFLKTFEEIQLKIHNKQTSFP